MARVGVHGTVSFPPLTGAMAAKRSAIAQPRMLLKNPPLEKAVEKVRARSMQ